MQREVPAPAEHRRDTPNVVLDERAARGDGPDAGAPDRTSEVEALRRSVRDLKHDVRMLKVGMDKQTLLLETLTTAVDELRSHRGRRR